MAYIAETGEWALRKQKRWDFSRSINLFGRVFPPFRSDAPALVFILEPSPHPHCPSHTIQWNAKQECSNFWINHIWYNILAKVRSSPEVKSTREKRKKNCHTDQNIQLGRSLKSVNSGESGLPAGHSPPSPSFPDRRYHHWCHRHQCTIIFVWP